MKQSIRKAKTNQLNKFKQRINKRFGGLLGLYFVTVQKHDEYLNIDIDDIGSEEVYKHMASLYNQALNLVPMINMALDEALKQHV